MAGKRVIKDNSQEESIDALFTSLFNALRNFKKLSEQEAMIYIEIMKKKQVTVTDVINIMKDKDIKTTTTKPYAIIKNLVDADLLFCKNKNERNKIYSSIHPRDLIMDIRESIKTLDNEASLMESEEVKVFEKASEYPEVLETEYEITNAVDNLLNKGYDIDFFYNPILINENHTIYKRLLKHVSLDPKKGKFCVIMASKKQEKIFRDIAILLLKNYKVNQKSDIIGVKIVDPEVFGCLKKEVGSNG